MNPYEGGAVRRADIEKRGRPLSEIERTAFDKAQRFIAAKRLRIDSFEGVYPAKEIERDKEKERELKERYEKELSVDFDKQRAILFEGLFCHQAQFNGWLGKNGNAIKTTDYDDYVNSVDAVAEFTPTREKPSHLALAIDVTFGKSAVPAKLERIRDEIMRGNPTDVKYFRSKNSGIVGSLSHVPRAIVGIEYETLADLARLWAQDDKVRLAQHPAQRLIAEELSRQISAGAELARERGSSEAIASYNQAEKAMWALRNEKGAIKEGDFADDRVYRAVIEGI